MDVAIALGKPHTAIRPTVVGVNHFPVITALDVDGADGFAMLAEMVAERVGSGPRAYPGTPAAEPFSSLDFVRATL